jgi:hypothetical protein
MQGHTMFQLSDAIWATPKSKQFVWLAVQHRIWTANKRRFRHRIDDATFREKGFRQLGLHRHLSIMEEQKSMALRQC